MASNPGIFTEWPWKKLESFKYVILAPWVTHSLYTLVVKGRDTDMAYFLIFPLLLWRVIHNQMWISFARFQAGRSKNLTVDRSIEFEQVDRESNWDDQILLSVLFLYLSNMVIGWTKNLPLWRTDGVVMTVLLHMGPVEFLYYWFHRALHHHFLYSRYHSHHHSSIFTEPITAGIHPFVEVVVYYVLFSIPLLTNAINGTLSILGLLGYVTYVDFMNSLGHCNFELVPNWVFTTFPFLKYLMYTPSFHSLHHTKFRTNYSLFMPFYDYLYGTADSSSDTLYEASRKGKTHTETPQVVHLIHPTTLDCIYHLRLGFINVASKPYASKWYIWMLWPITLGITLLSWVFGSTFTVENLKLNKLKMQTWSIPRFSFHYLLAWQWTSINKLIEKAILDAEERGVKVITLGLLNQGEDLNFYGHLYLVKNPNLKVRIVDGSSLAAGVVLNSIPQGATRVLLRGKLSKTGYSIALTLCEMGVQVATLRMDEFKKLKLHLPHRLWSLLAHSNDHTPEVWLVGDGLREEEQKKASKGTCFIPFSQFPVKRLRKDCSYFSTPAMFVPKELENMHACENWLPRRVMSAWRVAGIVHALEGWEEHECGDLTLDPHQLWRAAINHGFLPSLQL